MPLPLPKFLRPRPLRTLGALALCLLALGLPVRSAGAAPPPEVWFGIKAGLGRVPGIPDFPLLFRDDNPDWVRIASEMQVFLISSDHMFGAPDDEIVRMVDNLHSHHIKLAIAVMTIARLPDEPCGVGEGYEGTLRHQHFAERLARLHVRPDIIRIDGPFFAGHYIKCQLPIPELVRRAAPTISAWAQVFPGIVFGDVEPWIAIMERPGWQSDYAAMKQGIEAATGQKLAFVHSDTNDHNHPNWATELATVPPFIHRLGMQWGMIYDGRGRDPTDEAWLATARDRVVQMEDRLHVLPEQAIIQSWDRHPARALPAGDPTTLGSLLEWYVARRH